MSSKQKPTYVINAKSKENDLANAVLTELHFDDGHFLCSNANVGHDAFFYDSAKGTWRVGKTDDVLTLILNTLTNGKAKMRAKVSEDAEGNAIFGYVDIPPTSKLVAASCKLALIRARNDQRKPTFVPGLAFRNGFLRVDAEAKRFEFVEHSPANWAFSRIEKDWVDIAEPEKLIPHTLAMRDAVMREDGCGAENWQTLISCVALGAFGLGKQANAFLTIYGEGGNGKTTLIEALLRRAVENYDRDVAQIDMWKLGEPFVMHQLIGKKFNFRNEMDDRAVSNAACQIQKSLAEGKPVAIRKMYADEFSLELPVMCIYVGNHEMTFADTSKGFTRRHYHMKMEADLTKTGVSSQQLLTSVEPEQVAYLNYLKQAVERFWKEGHVSIPRSEVMETAAKATTLNYVRDCIEQMMEPADTHMTVLGFREIYLYFHIHVMGSGMRPQDTAKLSRLLAAETRARGLYNPHKGHFIRLRDPATWSGLATGAQPSHELQSLLRYQTTVQERRIN